MYNKSNIKQYIFRTKLICDLKVECVSGWFSLKQVNVIGLHSFNNECTKADARFDPHHFARIFFFAFLYFIFLTMINHAQA